MEALPEGWGACSPLDVADLIRGVSYEKGEAAAAPLAGHVALLRATNIEPGRLNFDGLLFVPASRVSPQQRLRAGDVVIAMSSGSSAVVGKAASLSESWDGTFGAFCGVLRPNQAIDPRFFGLFFQTDHYRKGMSSLAAGTNINNIKRQYFEEFNLPLPPLAEQKRIVEKAEALLAQVQAARDRLERVQQVLKRFRQAVLAAASEGKLAEAANAPWPVRPLVELISEPMANGRSVPDATRGFPVLRLTAIRGGRVDLSQRKIGDWSARDAKRFLVKRGDFLVARGNGSLSLVGRGGLVEDEPDPVAYPDTLIRIRPHLALLSAAFLRLVWDSRPTRRQIEDFAHTTAGIHKVSQKDLAAIELPCPPIDRQTETVRRAGQLLGVAVSIEDQLASARQRMAGMPQAILARAFAGALVPTEAESARRDERGYESGEQLLERVRASGLHRAVAGASLRGRRTRRG